LLPDEEALNPPPRQIRYRYAGLVAFFAKMLSALTGLVFVVLVTSRLSVFDFGVWTLISKVVGYCAFPALIVTFWVTRYTARGIRSGRTGFVSVFILSLITTGLYFAVAFFLSQVFGRNSGYVLFFFVLAAVQVFLYSHTALMEGIAAGVSPERASYGFLMFEVSKVILGGLLVGFLGLSLAGAIVSVAIAQILQGTYLALLFRPELKDKINFAMIKNWVRHSWISTLIQVNGLIINLDFSVVALFMASPLPLAFYGAAGTVASVVTYASWISSGLYPRLLSGGSSSDVRQTLDLVLLFLIPLSLGVSILAPQLLSVLKVDYVSSTPILYLLVASNATNAVYVVGDSALAGTDNVVELNDRLTFRDYRQSHLFTVVKTNLLLALGYIGLLFVLGAFRNSNWDPITLGEFWALAYLAMNIGVGTIKLWYARKVMPLTVHKRSLVKYIVASIPFSLALLLGARYIHPASVSRRLILGPELVGIGIAALMIYFSVLYLLDSNFRDLVARGIQLARGRQPK
jgi:hypothetical protein